MTDSKITDLAALTGANLATGDEFVLVDVSDTTMDASGTDKQMTADELRKGLAKLGIVGIDAIFDSKGDLVVGTGADAASRLAVGSDGAVFTADSSQSTGTKWVDSPGGRGVYGDGSDGTVTFDGTTTVLGIAPSSNTYILSRDVFLAAGTINNGVTINCAGFRLFCAGTLTNNGTINWPPVAASGSTGASALQKNTSSINITTTLGAAGGNGGTGAGSSGSNQTSYAYGGNGSAGGAGSSGAGGAAGTLTNPIPGSVAKARFLPSAVVPWILNSGSGATGNMYVPSGGAGGGGGGGDGTRAGGGGGCGGGIVVVAAYRFAGTGAIQCRGGAAGNGTAAGNCGGGSGGGGGLLIVISSSVASGAIPGQTCDANGGAGGTATGTGTNGSTGGSGTVILLPN